MFNNLSLCLLFLLVFSACINTNKADISKLKDNPNPDDRPRQTEPIIDETNANNILSQMTKISSEIEKAPAPDWNDYYIIKNVDQIDQADIVLFGDRHTSADALFDFINFGKQYFKPQNSIALFEENLKKTDDLKTYMNTWEYVISRLYVREQWLQSNTDVLLQDKVDAILKRDRAKLASSIWENVQMFGWDTIYEDPGQARKLSYERNGMLVTQLKKYASINNKVLVFLGAEHVPNYQIAVFRAQMHTRLQSFKEILDTKSIGRFFQLCKSLPSDLRTTIVDLPCDATENIWSYLISSNYKFALIVKKHFERDVWPEDAERGTQIKRLIPDQF